jgi:hypothetical protein
MSGLSKRKGNALKFAAADAVINKALDISGQPGVSQFRDDIPALKLLVKPHIDAMRASDVANGATPLTLTLTLSSLISTPAVAANSS